MELKLGDMAWHACIIIMFIKYQKHNVQRRSALKPDYPTNTETWKYCVQKFWSVFWLQAQKSRLMMFMIPQYNDMRSYTASLYGSFLINTQRAVIFKVTAISCAVAWERWLISLCCPGMQMCKTTRKFL